MAGPGRQLAAAEETGLRQALSHARSYNRGTTSIGSILLLQAKAMALPFSPEDVRKMNDALQASLTETKASPFAPTPTSQICGPIGAVAPHYGQAPYASVPGFADQNARQLDDFAASLRQAR